MKFDWKTTLCLSGFSLFLVPLAQAQFCTLTNASLNGAYGYVASQSGVLATSTGTGITGTGTTGTGTTGTTGTGTTGTTGTGTTGTGTTGTGTTTGTGSTGSFSNTGTGNLIGGITSGNLFAYSGVWVFGGNGIISAAQMPGGTAIPIGTYNVNPDCSLTISISDVFGTSGTATTSTAVSSAPTQLAGVILGHGSEIDLTSISSLMTSTTGTGTSGTGTTTGTGTSGTGTTSTNSATAQLQIKLVRVLFNNGCSDSNLAGLYGFVLNPLPVQTSSITTGTTGTGTTGTGTTGTGTTGTGTTGTGTGGTTSAGTTASAQPGMVIGYVDFNGAGQVQSIASLLASSGTSTTTGTSPFAATGTTSVSSFSSLDYTGTYTVYGDCSGTMTISNSSNTTSTTGTGTTTTGTGTATSGTGTSTNSGSSITINFVITQPEGPVGGLTNGAVAGAPNLVLSYSQGDIAGTGYALAQ